MKPLVTGTVVLSMLVQTGWALEREDRTEQNAKLLNLAILTLPDKFVSDLPLEERGGLLELFSIEEPGRLDYRNGFVDYLRDGAATYDKPSGSCRFWMKIFRAEDGTAFLFVHNRHPESPEEMNVFFRCDEYGDFVDVTSEYIPKEVDLSLHLRPQRESDTIRVAEYEEQQLEGGIIHRVGPQTAELIWTGKGFELRKTAPTKIPHLDNPKKKQ